MESNAKGQEHGAAVRGAAGFAADIVVALGKDVAFNVQRCTGYVVGFAQGLLGRETSVPNA